LPVAQSQVSKADLDDRMAIVGQNAFREFKIRGYACPLSWVEMDQSGTCTAMMSNAGGPMRACLGEPIIIDPMMINADTTPSATNKIHQFPHDEKFTWQAGTSNPAGLKRFSVFNVAGVKTSTVNRTADLANSTGAEAVFMPRDELIITPPTTPEGAPSQQTDSGANSPRSFEGNFTWMAMLASAYNDSAAPYPEMQCNLSIIVLYKRSTSQLKSDGIPLERAVRVKSFDGAGVGGGEITIEKADTTHDNKYLLVKPGEWLLLLSNDKKVAKWYKILNTDKYDPANPPTPNDRHITLAGPDWPTNYQAASTMTAIIVEGAVGVYSKSIKIEGQSMWSWW
jgi:hypothetical protein